MNPLKALGLATSALGHCTTGAMRSVGNGEAIDASTTLLDMCRRDWAVRVLDAWAKREGAAAPAPRWTGIDWRVTYMVRDDSMFETCQAIGDSPDAARLTAAEAAWPDLPESVRSELGERP